MAPVLPCLRAGPSGWSPIRRTPGSCWSPDGAIWSPPGKARSSSKWTRARPKWTRAPPPDGIRTPRDAGLGDQATKGGPGARAWHRWRSRKADRSPRTRWRPATSCRRPASGWDLVRGMRSRSSRAASSAGPCSRCQSSHSCSRSCATYYDDYYKNVGFAVAPQYGL